jgi:hypothetical protein
MIDRRDRKSPSTVIVTTTDRPNRLPHQPGFLISAEKNIITTITISFISALPRRCETTSAGSTCGSDFHWALAALRCAWGGSHFVASHFHYSFFWHEENIACKGVSSEGAAEAYCIACTGRQTGLALVQVE